MFDNPLFEKKVRFIDNEDLEEKYMDESEAIYDNKYKKYLESGEAFIRMEKGEYAVRTHLRKYWVQPHQKTPKSQIEQFAKIINEANDEHSIQRYLKLNPFFLTRKTHPSHHGQLCVPKPQFGCQYVPDFLIAGLDSSGLYWYGVELENPNKPMFNKDGAPSDKLDDALKQIRDWRSWLRENIKYAQDELGYTDIDADLPCYIIIGKRDNESLEINSLNKKRREVQKSDKYGLFLHHYEWLLDEGMTYVEVNTPRR